MSDTNEFSPLPALRGLGRLADVRPTIIVDSREQDRLAFHRLPSTVGTLQTGDYSVQGIEEHLMVERKSIPDLVMCCGVERDRFEREMHRARGFWFRRLVVVGTRVEIEKGEYRSKIKPKAVLSTLAMLEVRYGVPVCFFHTPDEAARAIESWAYFAAREICQNANTLLRSNPVAP